MFLILRKIDAPQHIHISHRKIKLRRQKPTQREFKKTRTNALSISLFSREGYLQQLG